MSFVIDALDIEASFSPNSLGRSQELLIGTNGKVATTNRLAWLIGYRAYELVFDSCDASPDDFTETSQEDHNNNLAETKVYVDDIFEYIAKNFFQESDGLTDLVTGNFVAFKDIPAMEFQQKANFLCTLMLVNNLPPVCFPPEYIFYCVMYSLDAYIEVRGSDSELEKMVLNMASQFLGAMHRVGLAQKEAKRKSKKAANAKHQKTTYLQKERLKEWHKNNRHDFLKPDGSLHQGEAAEHVRYVLKIKTPSAKKIAEYMGEFERELLQR